MKRLIFLIIFSLVPSWSVAIVSYDDTILNTYSTGLKGFYPLAYDINDFSINSTTPVAKTGITFSGPSPIGFKYSINSAFDGSTSKIQLENTAYSFQTTTWTISCWFKMLGAGVTTVTAGGADGFPTANPIVPLVTKGRGEGESPANINMNWFFGINKINNGTTYRIGGDFENTVGGGNTKIVGTTLISIGTWYFGAYVNYGSSHTLYLNGVQESSATLTTTPESTSIQKAGIGSAYNSTGVSDGYFNGQIAGVGIWNRGLSPSEINYLYNVGTATYRNMVTYSTQTADNWISHGADFANWSADAVGSVILSTGPRVVGNSGNYAKITVTGLASNTTYWAQCVISSVAANVAGNLRVSSLTVQGASISGIDNLSVNIGTWTGTYYFKVHTNNTSSPHYLIVEHIGSPSGSFMQFNEFKIYPIPSNSAKIAWLGDREGVFDAARGHAVDTIISVSTMDNVNVICSGDLAATADTYENNNGVLLASITAKGGLIYPTMGNHDYDSTRETEILPYFSATTYNGGKTYYSRAIGNNVKIHVWDDMNDVTQQPDNANGISATVSVNELSTAGAHILYNIAHSTHPWNIFLVHHPPYSSGSPGPTANNRWDFPGLGIPLVGAGHVHGVERLYLSGTTYITNARGGCDHHGWGTPVSQTQWRENDVTISGYYKIYDSPTVLILEFYDTNGNLRDRHKITNNYTSGNVVTARNNFMFFGGGF